MSSFTLSPYNPLFGKKISSQKLSIKHIDGRAKLVLSRSNQVSDKNMKAIVKALGAELPAPCRLSEDANKNCEVLWCSPNKWIILCNENKLEESLEKLRLEIGSLKAGTVTITDVSDQFQHVEINQQQAVNFLAKGCSLDLRESVFKKDHVASTLLAQSKVTLWRAGDGGFQILFDTSHSNYLWQWMSGAADEFS